ncbi:Ionotropic receptor 209 [Hyalella azteca]|uniref:Ionotropic receptor 209 n=1 Tax=Hyalella azteca TaxID=294128 RepID=A0A6A0GPE6_HYAAZ|nr:Ionotropic receptor 209 [Hyalella azteca]
MNIKVGFLPTAADLAVGTCVLTQERAQIAHSFEWFELQGTFISTAALKTLQQPFLIADIFKAEVWLLVLAVTAAATIAFLFIQTIMDEPRDIVEIPLRAILSQGYSPRTGYFATRLLELVTWAFTIPLVALYAGNLTASLSSPRFEAPVNSWSDLAARPDKIPVFFPNDPIHQLLVNKSGVLGEIYRKAIIPDNLIWDAISRRVIRRAMVERATSINLADGRGLGRSCNVRMSDDSVSFSIIVLFGGRNSQFEEPFNKRIRQLRSFGVVEKLYRTFVRDGCYLQSGRRKRRDSGTANPSRLTLEQLQGAFWLYILGNILACVVIFLEGVIHRRQTKRN